VTPDELADPDYLVISCAVDGEKVPEAWTGNLIFSVPSSSTSCAPCSRSARRCHQHLAGAGATRQPPRFLQPGQVLESWIEGIGTVSNRCR
jgi:2,4-didehydro-3-deoxy-L-rhamnonate hydrolase